MDVDIEVSNDRTIARFGEAAFAGIPVAQTIGLSSTEKLVVTDANGQPVAAQFRPLARWGGVVDDTKLPIRWLEVALIDDIAATATNRYRLKQYDNTAASPPAPLTVSDNSGKYLVDTGVAQFTIDPTNPALIDKISLGDSDIYTHQAGAGPKLIMGGGSTVLDTSQAGQVTVDSGSFKVIDEGPVKATFALQGHFVDAGGASSCDQFTDVPAYESLGFTVVLTFTRGQGHVDLQLQFRNECSDMFSGDSPWPGARTIDQVSWELPLSFAPTATRYYAGGGPIADSSEDVTVEQRKGAGNPWLRRARVQLGSSDTETGEAFDMPMVGLSDSAVTATAQLAWMRFREPQALVADQNGLSVRIVSEALTVGAAKGLWNFARLSFVSGASAVSELETLRSQNAAALERGLLVRASLSDINDARIFPSLGTDSNSAIKDAYTAIMARFHDATVGETGQWARHKTYGSQLWPDIQTTSYPNDMNAIGPSDNAGGMNYWNPSRAESYEFFRTGAPQWAWDFSLPQTWLQLFTAYGNIGEYSHGNRNGFALNSAVCDETLGCEEGQWHRYALGSDDYTYTVGNLAYAIRPNYAMNRRFAAAGRTAIDRYSIPSAQEGERDQYVSVIDLTRQVIQHFTQLSNCAEFVAGVEGQACHDRLLEIVTELVEDNMDTGLLCQGDIQPPESSLCEPFGGGSDPNADWCDCVSPQQFMINSLMMPFLLRFYLNYGDVGGKLRAGLAMSAWHYYREGMGFADGEAPSTPSDEVRPAILLDADWLGQPGWDTDSMPYTVVDIDVTDDDPATSDPGGVEANLLLAPNKPQMVAGLLIAHDLDPTLRLCEISKTALDDATLPMLWGDYDIDGGWWKGPSQAMQSMVFGVGLYDVCSD